MGNTMSSNISNSGESDSENNITTLPYLIDEIALHYMLTQNAIDLHKLTHKDYNDNLIILTSNVIEKRLNNLELGYLNNRISGKDVGKDLGKDVGKDLEIQDIMPATSKMKDKIITNISKFYIKIFMMYSAIVSTFDPQYSYLDENGEKKLFYLKDSDEYKNIPSNVKPLLVQLTNPMSLCRKRLNILKNRYDDTSEPGSVILNPGEKLCSVESTVKLTDEIGIKELDSLYYDIFDYNTKQWSKKSSKMKKKYNKDLILFYRIFTGKKTKPAYIKSFQDIELLDFKKINSCSDNTFLSDIVISKENKLVKDYKEKIDLIQNSTEINRTKLYGILKELFVIKMIDNEQSYTINPSLTLDKILILEEQTRMILLDLYISCEKYFIQALIIFENIYESKDYTISEYRKENLMKMDPLPIATSLNFKDTLTITPPFSPDISGQLFQSETKSISNSKTDSESDKKSDSESESKPGLFETISNFINPKEDNKKENFKTNSDSQPSMVNPQTNHSGSTINDQKDSTIQSESVQPKVESSSLLTPQSNEPKFEGTTEVKPEGTTEVKPEGIAEVKPEGIAEVKPEGIAEVKPEGIAEAKPELMTQQSSLPTPQSNEAKPDPMSVPFPPPPPIKDQIISDLSKSSESSELSKSSKPLPNKIEEKKPEIVLNKFEKEINSQLQKQL